MKIINLKITGMTCDHCAQSAQDALNALDGVNASVSFDKGMATIETQGNIDNNLLLKAVESKGYGATFFNDTNTDDTNEVSTSGDDGLHVAIVGTGSGAFAAAIKAVEQGAHVTIIEGADIIGGTCVNIGCVPSKIMIRGAHIVHIQGQHNFEGVPFNQPVVDRKAMVAQQQQWVENLRHAKYESILESNPGINLLRGMARFKDNSTLIVTKKDGSEKEIKADRILLAVGARPMIPNIDGLADTPYWTSTEALIAEKIPKHLVVLGGSVVALELAQAFRHLGSEVTVMARSSLLSKEDADIGSGLKDALTDEGMNIRLNTVPTDVSHDGKQFVLTIAQGVVHCDQLLVATGRQSNADTLALENAGVSVADNGTIIIDDHMRTNEIGRASCRERV